MPPASTAPEYWPRDLKPSPGVVARLERRVILVVILDLLDSLIFLKRDPDQDQVQDHGPNDY